MPDQLPNAIEKLRRPLWITAATNLLLVASVLGMTFGAFKGYTSGVSWVFEQASLNAANKTAIKEARDEIAGLHVDIVSLDKRVNELRANVLALDNLEAQATRDLRARLDTMDAVQRKIDELAKFNTDRTFQAPLPQGPRR